MNDALYPEEEEKQVVGFARELIDWAEALVGAVIFIVLVFTFLGRTSSVVGESMYATLEENDKLIISRLFYQPKQGDIVCITRPYMPNEPLVKRVIATQGQTVDIDFEQGIVYVDGQELDEPYIYEPTYTSFDMEFPITVPQGRVFVMGDNRNASLDSRATIVGCLDERYILGKVLYRFMPFEHMGVPR